MGDYNILEILTFAGLCINVGMFIATWRMANVAKKTLDERSKPHVIIYPQVREDFPTVLEIIVENIGTAPAYDVKFSYSDNLRLKNYGIEKASSSHGTTIDTLFEKGIPYLPAGKQRKLNWGQFAGIQKALKGKNATVYCTFREVNRNIVLTSNNVLGIDDFRSHTANTPYYVKQVNKLEDIAKELKKTNSTLTNKLKPISSEETYKYVYLSYLLLKDKYSEKRLTSDSYIFEDIYIYKYNSGLTPEQIEKAETEAIKNFNKYKSS